MTIDKKQRPLALALDQLEEHLETPIIAGELTVWLDATSDLLGKLEQALNDQIEHAHPVLYDQIARDDAGLMRRVEQMQAEDQRLLSQLAHHQKTIQNLQGMAVKAEPNELKVEEHVTPATDVGIELIIAIRKQERALDTWLQEAELRDNGGSG